MDYTLAQYRPETFEALVHQMTVEKLVTKLGYPEVRSSLSLLRGAGCGTGSVSREHRTEGGAVHSFARVWSCTYVHSAWCRCVPPCIFWGPQGVSCPSASGPEEEMRR